MIDSRVLEGGRAKEAASQPITGAPISATNNEGVPTYQQKKFFETNIDDFVNRASEGGKYTQYTANQMAANRSKKESSERSGAVDYFRSIGLGDIPLTQILANKNNADFLAAHPQLGKAYSYADLAQEALQGDPNFEMGDEAAIASFAQELEKRGLNNTQREKIANLAVSQSISGQIDKAKNPGKYLDETKKAENLATAQRLLKQNYGDDFNDPDLQQFLTDRLAEGESAFEVSQFLQTTPQFLEKKATAENERVKTESAAARESLNQELLKSQQEVFQRAQPSIISSYMKAGRLNSSGLNNALAQAQAELEKERQGFLANAGYNDAIRAQGYGREDFVNNNAQAFNQYLRQNEPAYQQRFAVNNASNFANYQMPYNNLSRQYQLADESRQRQYQVEDYNRMQSDYMRYLSSQGGNGMQGALKGALAGGQAGSAAGPWGALIGAGAGAAGGYYAYK